MKPEKIVFRTPYNYDVDLASEESGLKCLDPSLARESEAEGCDINEIVRRFGLTGQMPVGGVAFFADVSAMPMDYHSALQFVQAAEEGFALLPAELRARFRNDPGALVEFLEVEGNRAEAEKLGIVAVKVKPDLGGAVEKDEAAVSGPAAPAASGASGG